jgi:hypothetical protein
MPRQRKRGLGFVFNLPKIPETGWGRMERGGFFLISFTQSWVSWSIPQTLSALPEGDS